MKSTSFDLEDLERTILNFFDREIERIRKMAKEEKGEMTGYFSGRIEEAQVMRRIIRTHLKEEIKRHIWGD